MDSLPSMSPFRIGVRRGALGNLTPSSPLVIVDSADPKITRQFGSVEALAEEQRMVRIWGGFIFAARCTLATTWAEPWWRTSSKPCLDRYPERRSAGAEELKLSSNC